MKFARADVVHRTLIGASLVAICVGAITAMSREKPAEPPSPAALQDRDRALAGARVFLEGSSGARPELLLADPNAGVVDSNLTTCRFLPAKTSGTTPKFECALPSGEKIKVKYGWTREIPAEIAGTRLLSALGFPADRMSAVKTLRCFGCVIDPFHVLMIAGELHLTDPFVRHLNYSRSIDFVNVSVERKIAGESIEPGDTKGWAFYELNKVDPSKGGATAPEIDALRLMAAFLNHWDNKAENQRLVCAPGTDSGTPCAHPLLVIQDLGSDFGPYKLNLDGWRKHSTWKNGASCQVSMQDLPFHGSTFVDVTISEAGRKLLAQRLAALPRDQVEALFRAAGFKNVSEWVAAFERKVGEIADHPPCA